MQLIRGLENLQTLAGCVATIGNFDGVHLAHQKILSQVVQRAKRLEVPSVVISFVPHPADFFGKNTPVLSSFKQKYQLLKDNNIDIVLFIHFNTAFANIQPQVFIDTILIDKLHTQMLFVGDDFRFGKNRVGDIALLQQHLTISHIDELLLDDVRISSSHIRRCLATGDFATARNMLGRAFSICGKVIFGKQLGATIGFPTANIAIKNQNLPVRGVFATDIIIDNIRYSSITNVGVKPTIDSVHKLGVEVHIFDFNQNIYHKNVEVIFKYKIRDEQTFATIDALQQQIQKDCLIALNS
jgi:riboflavin kinase/FMN adenylyltransferase